MVNEQSSIRKEFTYDAFISYRHMEPDITIAKKLHRLLESYRIPKSVAKHCGIKKIKRVFRDQEELPTSADLSEDIRIALANSRYLIVVCSKNTPLSEWCCEEIDIFRNLHENNRILSILIDGEPEEAFPYQLRFRREKVKNPDDTYSIIEKEVEPLAADIRSGTWGKALKKLKIEKLRLLAPMLEVSFDDLRQRHKEQFIKKAIGTILGVSLFFAAFGGFSLYQSNIIAVQSSLLMENNEEIKVKNTDLENINIKLRDQITETEKQRDMASKNGEEAIKQAKAAEINASLAAKNEKQAIESLYEAEAQKALAISNERLAEENAQKATEAKILALSNEKKAKEQRDQALINQSLYLADQSRQQLAEGDRILAAMLALEALPKDPDNPDRPFVIEAEAALRHADLEKYIGDYRSRTILQHDGKVHSISFSPDGSKVVTSSDNKIANIWDTATGAKLVRLVGHGDFITAAEFSPDGSKVVTASADNTAIIWDTTTGEKLATLEGHGGGIITAVFSPDGKKVVTTSFDKTARTWDAATGGEIAKLDIGVYNDEIWSNAEFSPDGEKVVTASYLGTARIWDAETGKELVDLNRHNPRIDEINAVRFSTDGSKVVTASSGAARIWDAATGKELAVLKGHSSFVVSAIFSPDGRRLVTASWDKTAIVWDVATGRELISLKGHSDKVNYAEFNPDSSKIVTASADKTAIVWEVATGREIAKLEGHGDSVNTARFSFDGSEIITASDDKTARIWDISTGKNLVRLNGNFHVGTVEFDPSGNRMIAAGRIWDISTGKELVKLEGLKGSIKAHAFSPDGSKVAATIWDNHTVRICDAFTGKILATLQGGDREVLAAKFSPDGSKMVTLSADYTANVWDSATGIKLITLDQFNSYKVIGFSPDCSKAVTEMGVSRNNGLIWDLHTGKEIAKLIGHRQEIQSAEFSPDGSKAVTASYDKTARIWDAATGDVIFILEGHKDRVNTAVFSTDGSKVVTASDDKTVRIWDAETGKELVVMEGHSDKVNYAEFSSDSSKVISTSYYDGTARIWDVKSGKELDMLRTDVDYANMFPARFSPDGNRAVTPSRDGTAIIWPVRTLNELVKKCKTSLNERKLSSDEKAKFFLRDNSE